MDEQREKKYRKLVNLLEKLFVCYRLGQQPGAWLNDIARLRKELDIQEFG